jgi:hypothetical protein
MAGGQPSSPRVMSLWPPGGGGGGGAGAKRLGFLLLEFFPTNISVQFGDHLRYKLYLLIAINFNLSHI